MSTTKKILILAANPKDTHRLRLDQEVRDIKEGLHRAKHRDQFNVQSQWAVRLRDLRRALLDEEPQIVHFCGHGEVDGLMVEEEQGNAVLVSGEALAGLFELFEGQIECVLLNACYSEPQATAINEHIPYVIGMSNKISDEAALEFAVGFYDALGAGKSFEKAFKFGCNAIQLYDIPEHLTPVFLKNPDASDVQAKAEPQESVPSADSVPPEKKGLYDLLAEKINRLKTALILETDPARKFQMEQQLKEAENDLKKMIEG